MRVSIRLLAVVLVLVVLLPCTGCVFDNLLAVAMNPEFAGEWVNTRLDQVDERVDQGEVIGARWLVIVDQILSRITPG